MSEKIDKKAILEEIKKKLEAPIPGFWKASITLGKMSELQYYSKVIVGQTFCGRQKDRLKQRIISGIVKDLDLILEGKIAAPKLHEKYAGMLK